MLQNYFRVLMRSLWKARFFSSLNFLGLALGMTCYLLIVQYASYELSYDDFHENKDNIYRLQRDVYENNALKTSMAKTSFNIGPAMVDEFPEVKESVRCAEYPSNTVIYGDKIYRDESIYVTESSFFKIFSFQLLQGNKETCLEGPGRLLLSRTTALKFFGEENPVGKHIRILSKGKEYDCTVNGVFADVPGNSLLQFNMLLSMDTIWNSYFSDWVFSTFHTYLQLDPGAKVDDLLNKFPGFIDKYVIQNVPRASNWKLRLQPIKDIYLYSDITFDTENGNGEMVYFLLIIAFLIMVISWINYVNLSTARAMERAREVGIRKVFGGHRVQLIKQFLAESLMVNLLPILIALLLLTQFMPFLSDLTGKNIPLGFSSPFFWIHLLLLYLFGSLSSGLYPAFVLSSFKPVTMLNRSRFSHTRGGRILRKFLVGFQFTAATALIIVTLSVYQQIDYMRNRDLGIQIRDIVALQLPSIPRNQKYIDNVTSLKTELLRYPSIESMAGSSSIPGTPPELQRLTWREGRDFKNGKPLSIIFTDYDFMSTYGISFEKGRNFSKSFGTDNSAIILNQAAVQALGFESPESAINNRINLWQLPGPYNVIGVIRNYHHQSLKKSYDPMVFILKPNIKSFYSIKIGQGSGAEGQTLRHIRKQWELLFPGHPLHYFFLDDHFDRQYAADRQFGKVLGVFVVLILLITCMGLLSLFYFNTLQRTREIGVRKSFGATVRDILTMLLWDTGKTVGLSVVIAWPLAFIVVDNWLKNYANRIPLPWPSFIFAGLILTFLSLMTVAYHAISAAGANPVDSLRDE